MVAAAAAFKLQIVEIFPFFFSFSFSPIYMYVIFNNGYHYYKQMRNQENVWVGEGAVGSGVRRNIFTSSLDECLDF
jgi:hypothetical protein